MDGMLSQEEINALLSGIGTEPDTSADVSSTMQEQDEILTEEEKDAIGEISNISLGTAATTLFSLVNQKVVITTPKVSVSTWDDLVSSYGRPCVFIQIYYKEGLEGNNILILKEDDVKIIADLMMGGDGTNLPDELTELHLSAISEAMNQMMGSSSTSLSSILDKVVDISPPVANVVDMNDNIKAEEIADFLKDKFIKVSFKMEIGNLVDSELMQLYPVEFTKDLYRKFTSTADFGTVKEAAPASDLFQAQTSAPETNQPDPVPMTQTPTADANAMNQMNMNPMNGMNMNPMGVNPMNGMGVNPMNGMGVNPMNGMGMNPMNGMNMNPMNGMNMNPMGMGQMNGWPMGNPMMQNPYPQYQQQPMPEINVQPAQFAPFNSNPPEVLNHENIDLLRDVPLEVTVELGRTSKSIKEILEFTPGSIIELNRLAGEPIDVLVNGKYVAKGEVVVIEEVFNIRITEIIK